MCLASFKLQVTTSGWLKKLNNQQKKKKKQLHSIRTIKDEIHQLEKVMHYLNDQIYIQATVLL